MNHWLVIYDIREAKRLSKVAKIMEQYALRVQQSVFEIDAEEKIIQEMRERVKSVMEDDDFVVYFRICESDWQKRMKFGVGARLDCEDKEFYIL